MDQKLLFLINREWTHPALDWLMALLSSFDFWGPVLVLLIIVLAIRGGFRVRAFLLVAALSIGVTDGLVCNPLKRVFDKPRPHQALAGVRQVDLGKAKPRLRALGKPLSIKISNEPTPGEDVDGRSFPSSHTANTAALAYVAWRFFGRRGMLAFLLPLAVGYSRIYTGSHWPSDVALSLLLGIGVAAGLLLLLSRLWREYGSRLLPEVRANHPSLLAA